MKQRMLSLLLCSAIFCSAFSGTALTGKAKESSQGDSTYDDHIHTDDCYHMETNCIYSADSEEGATSETEKGHVCSEESGCVKQVWDCPYAEGGQEGEISESEGVQESESKKEEEPGDTNEEHSKDADEQNPEDMNEEDSKGADEQNPEDTMKEESKDIKGQDQESNKKEEKIPLVVASWEWVDEEELLVWSEELGQWGLGFPGANEENKVTSEILKEMLPMSITASLADGQTEILTLDWDFHMLPEDGAFEGSYVLTAGLPEGYVLGDEAEELAVLVELSGGEIYRDPVQAVEVGGGDKFVSNWNYISVGGFEIRENKETYEYTMDYYLSIEGLFSDKERLIYKLEKALPQKIYGSGTNKGNSLVLAGFIPESENYDEGKITGNVKIEWNISEVINNLSFIQDGDKVTFDAKPISNEGYRLRINTNDPTWRDSKDGEADTAETEGVLNLTLILHDLHLEEHTVPGINPPNTTVNLFDYWVDTDGANGSDILGTHDRHHGEKNLNVDRTGVEDWNKGINVGRLLLFGDGNIHAGFWNKGAGAGSNYGQKASGMPGIVESVLENGYPVINKSEMEKQISNYEGISDWKLCGDHIGDSSNISYEGNDPKNISNTVINNWRQAGNNASLDYLFKPEASHTNHKRSYEDVKGLFQIDSNGYYYYDMRQNFAEYDDKSHQFILYDAPAVDRTDAAADGSRSIGNFFPFNTGAQVFDMLDENTEKISSSASIQSNNLKTDGNYMNHHLGMTVNIDFRQPLGGILNTGATANTPMTFQFSGDDDVWIFIDDVLVLDLGGIHSEIYGTIDFSSGKVFVGQSWKTNGFPYNSNGTVNLTELYDQAPPTQETTLKEQFKKAGKEDATLWNGDTFASNTSHTLKMFYLERGNYDSSLALRFNLQPLLYQQIKKVDQNGSPLAGVEFDLYPAEETTANTPGAIECFYTDTTVNSNQIFYVKKAEGNSFVHLTTASDGTARFLDSEGNYFNFADRGNRCYILKETKTPNGYRTLPEDIVLYYDPSTSMLSVANRWNTGAYACSLVHATGTGSLNYGTVNTAQGKIELAQGLTVSREKQNNSLVVAIPMLLQKSSHTWETLYGSNISGFSAFSIGKNAGSDAWETAALNAALEQAADNKLPDWNLYWDSESLHLTGVLSDLPGLANRYTLVNPDDGDMQMLYGLIEPEALRALGIQGKTAEERYEQLGKYVRENGVENTRKKIQGVSVNNNESGNGFGFLNPGQFNRNFRSLIYIPNEERELWVMKIDQDGKPRNGARFGLYNNAACAGNPVAQGVTATVNGQEGTLIFSPANDSSSGHARILWASSERTHYYLREISAPDGCTLNDTIIPVVVGTYSIYADAGTEEDGVSVLAGVGRLTQSMRQFATSDDVDITLRDITVVQQAQPSSNTDVFVRDWQDVKLKDSSILRALNLHYGKNAVVDYGLHNEDGGRFYKPFFVAETGFIRMRVKQNYAALTRKLYEEAKNDANKDDLGDTDLTNLFSLLNIVVVTDQTRQSTDTGRLVIGKMLSGAGLQEEDYTKNFVFTVRLTDENGQELPGEYYFYGTDKAGYLSSGEEFPLHHDEEVTILGLPAGTKFTVTEKSDSAQGWYVFPKTGTVSGEIRRDTASFAPFYNSREPWPDIGSLILQKTVTGEGDKTKEFTFTVSLTHRDGTPLEGDYPYFGDKEGRISNGGSVTLRHDQHILIRDLPAGIQYKVSEKEADQDGYTTDAQGEHGIVADGELHLTAFINGKETKTPADSEPDSGQDVPQNPNPKDESGSRETSLSSPKTGIDDLFEALTALCIIFLLGLGAVLFACRKELKARYGEWLRRKHEEL